MRPVLLELAGFASFRESTTIDFRDAEYFALVGPTGSGKSTVIDALTFALYGSVPRWDDRRAVALALAPTAGRGAVRFVFDVGGQRYVVARELRRAASGGVSVRAARLERLVDGRGIGDVAEETEPIADGAGATTAAVETLLGLPFGDFCTCVVLPQGDFAEFLHTEPRKRQEKLVRLLGLGVYDVIAKAANSEAAEQRLRAGFLSEQLVGYSDATDEAAGAAAARTVAMQELSGRVAAAVPELVAAVDELRAAEELVGRVRAERDLLSALVVPVGIDRLHARERSASTARDAARDRMAAAETADGAARTRLAEMPARGHLEQLRREHAELAAGQAELPGLTERGEKAGAAYQLAVQDAADAQLALDGARTARETAAGALGTAQALLRRLVAERDGFRAVAVPPAVDVLDRRRVEVAAALSRADVALAAAEAADSRARAELAAAPTRGPLEQVRRDRHTLIDTTRRLRAAESGHAEADRIAAVAAADAAAARHRLEHAQSRRAAEQRRDLAATLRPELSVDDDCPVCAQRVRVLPEPLPAADLEAAEQEVAAAGRVHEDASGRASAAGTELTRAAAAVAGLREAVGRLWSASVATVVGVVAAAPVAGGSASTGSEPAAAESLALFARLSDGLAAAGVSVSGVGDVPRNAGGMSVGEVGGVPRDPGETSVGGAGGVPRTASETSVGEAGGPPRDAGWMSVGGAGGVPRNAGGTSVGDVEGVPRNAGDTSTGAAERDTVTHLTSTVMPDDAAVRAIGAAVDDVLAALDRLTERVDAGDAAVRTARRERAAATDAATAVGADVVAAAAELRAARDPLVPLGAPAIDGEDVLAGWTALVDWARAEAAGRERSLPDARAAADAAEADRDAADRAVGVAESAVRDSRAAETAAARAEQEARDAVTAIEQRAGALRRSLAGALTDTEAAAALARRDELEAATEAADTELRAARAALRSAERAASEIGHEVAAAWHALRAARDPLVPLDAPAPAGEDLLAAWIALTDWARTRIEAAAQQLAAAEHAARAARERRAADERTLAADLDAHGVAVHGPLADSASAAVAAALERARGEQRRLAERRAAAASITAERDAAESGQQVAKMLGGLLRSDGFPRWLVASALDVLVADASASLIELSGGQFELTHAGGEFLVIDHTDADARRPVKTLSGGETFQASLALALALSGQMSGLAARGTARLESIFLDEGFGTLDEANLEIVASTLENLVARGDRVVGLITHVPALAERVPVRFAVSRDERTSRAVRETA